MSAVPPARSAANETTLATVQEPENSSGWNHIFKLQRRRPPQRRTQKELSLWHAHESAPTSYICPAYFWVDGNVPGLSRKTKCPQQKHGGRRDSNLFVVGTFGTISFFCGQCATQVLDTVGVSLKFSPFHPRAQIRHQGLHGKPRRL